MDNSPVILSIPQFAELVGMNARSVYRMAQHRRIPCIRIGGTIRIDRDAALASLQVPAIAEVR
jgi:excisionase family DNA binding protein